MKNILSYKRTLTICAVVLTLISLRMHLDPAGITENEFPYAKGDAFDVAVTIRHLLGSLPVSYTHLTLPTICSV